MKKFNHMDGLENILSFLKPSKYLGSYIDLSIDRIIFLNENFTKETATALTALLLYYDNESEDEEITIYINSDGGDAAALTNIYDVIQMIKAPVQTICLGKAYSAGAFLLAAGTKGMRYIMPHAQVMIHGLQCIFPAPGEEHPLDSKNYLDFLNLHNDGVMKMLAKHTGHPLAKIKEDCSNDLYLSAKEAIAYGLADHILS